MSLLDKLSSIFHFDFSRLKTVHIHIFSDNKVEKTIIQDNRAININVGSVDPQSLQKFQQAIRKAVNQEKKLLLESGAKKTLDEFQKVDSLEKNRKLLEYFKGKISPTDISMLRASFFLREVHEKGQPVGQLKLDIINRYGYRGANISNLCTERYFESLIQPLYEQMAVQKDFTLEKFQTAFEVIVTQFPFAVFISSRMTQNEVKTEVINKMEINKKYGIRKMNIHGIGASNVKKILLLLEELSSQFTTPPEIHSGGGHIAVTIWF